MVIRDAKESDIQGIMEIYNDAVINTDAIWNYAPVDEKNRLAWLKTHKDAGLPITVAEENGKIAGYASLSEWRPFDGYKYTVENSVYVSKDFRGQGIGRRLMTDIINRAENLGLHAIVAGIEAENRASVRLHESLGFKDCGTLREVGTKHDRWLDLTFMLLLINDGTENKNI